MSTSFSTRSSRLVAIFGLSIAMLASPIAVAADTIGGGNADLGLDAITVTATSVAGRTGLVTVTGRVDCSQDLTASIWVDISQVVGRTATISGGGEATAECLASTGSAPFSVAFYAWSGRFAGGPARVEGFAETGVCTDEACLYDVVQFGPTNVRLSH
jgi:hypothetical protein